MEILEETARKSLESGRKREVFNLHENYQDAIQRLVNVIQPDSHVRAHKHESTTETFIALMGRIELNEYDDSGEISDRCIIEPCGMNMGVEIGAGKWHSLVALERDSAVFIIMKGPYNPSTHKIFAEWEEK